MIATALLAAIGDIHAFKNGRELAAWLGVGYQGNIPRAENRLC